MPTRADMVEGVVISIGLLIMIVGAIAVPVGSALQFILIGIGAVIVFFEAVILELVFEFFVMSYTYLRVECHPSGEVLHAFLVGRIETKPISKTINASKFRVKWPVDHEKFGEFFEFVIMHEGVFWNRARKMRGWSFFKGWAVPHNDVHKVIVNETEYSSSDLWEDKNIPSFQLVYAHGGDYELVPPAMTSVFYAAKDVFDKHPDLFNDPVKRANFNTILRSLKHYAALIHQRDEAKRQSLDYREKALALERAEETRGSQTRGLLRLQTDASLRALELLLAWWEVYKNITAMVKAMSPNKWTAWLNKWTAMAIVAVVGIAAIALLATQPSIQIALGTWSANPIVAVMVSIVAICIVAVIFLMTRNKGGVKK